MGTGPRAFILILMLLCPTRLWAAGKVLGIVEEPAPPNLFHWLSRDVLDKMANQVWLSPDPLRLPMRNMHPADAILKNVKGLEGTSALFTWSNPVTGMAASPYEVYGDRAILIRMPPHPVRVLELETDDAKGAVPTVDPSQFDVVHHVRRDAKSQKVIWEEWIITNPAAVESWTADPNIIRPLVQKEVKRIERGEKYSADEVFQRGTDKAGTLLFNSKKYLAKPANGKSILKRLEDYAKSTGDFTVPLPFLRPLERNSSKAIAFRNRLDRLRPYLESPGRISSLGPDDIGLVKELLQTHLRQFWNETKLLLSSPKWTGKRQIYSLLLGEGDPIAHSLGPKALSQFTSAQLVQCFDWKAWLETPEGRNLADELLSSPGAAPSWVAAAFLKQGILSGPSGMEWLEAIARNDPVSAGRVLANHELAGKAQFVPFIERMLAGGTPDIGKFLEPILGSPEWIRLPESEKWLKQIVDSGKGSQVIYSLMSKEWEERPGGASLLLYLVSHWHEEPFSKQLEHFFELFWENNLQLRELCGGKAPTLAMLQAHLSKSGAKAAGEANCNTALERTASN